MLCHVPPIHDSIREWKRSTECVMIVILSQSDPLHVPAKYRKKTELDCVWRIQKICDCVCISTDTFGCIPKYQNPPSFICCCVISVIQHSVRNNSGDKTVAEKHRKTNNNNNHLVWTETKRGYRIFVTSYFSDAN